MAYINTNLQAADILTKPFTNSDKWSKALELMRISPEKQHSRKAAAAAQPPNGALKRPEAEINTLIVEVAFVGEPHMKMFVPERYPSFSWITLEGYEDINSVAKWREVLEVARKLYKNGASILVWLRLPSLVASTGNSLLTDGKVGSSFDRKRFNKSWASFVDISTGLDAIKSDYFITTHKRDGLLDHERVRKGMKSHKIRCGCFDACCLNYQHPSGMLARSSATVASNVESIRNKFACLRCNDRDNRLKCRSSDSPSSLQIGKKLLQHYKEHCMKPVVKTTAMVASWDAFLLLSSSSC